MPDRLADDLLLFIRQNKGALSKKRREREFKGDGPVITARGYVATLRELAKVTGIYR